MGKGTDILFFFFIYIGTGVILQDSCAFLHTGPKAHKLFGWPNSEDNTVDVDGFEVFPESLAKHDTNRWTKPSEKKDVELWSWGPEFDFDKEFKLITDASHKLKEPARKVEEPNKEHVKFWSFGPDFDHANEFKLETNAGHKLKEPERKVEEPIKEHVEFWSFGPDFEHANEFKLKTDAGHRPTEPERKVEERNTEDVELLSFGPDFDHANEFKLKTDAGHRLKEPERKVKERNTEVVDMANAEEIPLPALDSQFLLVSSFLPAFLRMFTANDDEFLHPMVNEGESFQTSSFSIITLPEIQEEMPTQSLKQLPGHVSASESKYTTDYPMCPRYSESSKPELATETSIAPSTKPSVTSSSESCSSSSSSSDSSSSSSSSTSSSESSFSGMKLEEFSGIRKLIRKLKNTEISVQLDENDSKDKDKMKPSREVQHRITRRKISFSV